MKREGTSMLWLTLLLGCTAGNAWANPPPQDVAGEHFNRGLELARAADYDGSVAAFQAAYEAAPHYSVLYNLAQSYIGLGQPVEAVSSLEHYLEEGAEQIDAQRKARVLELIGQQRRRIGFFEIEVAPEGAEVIVNGRNVGTSPLKGPLALAMGTYGIVVRQAGALPWTGAFKIQPGERTQLKAKLEAAPDPTQAEAVDTSEPMRTASRVSVQEPVPASLAAPKRQLHWSLGTGVAGLSLMGAGVATYLWNGGRYDDWRGRREALNAEFSTGVTPELLQRDAGLWQEGLRLQRADDIAIGLGVAGAATAITAGLLWWSGIQSW